MGKNFLVIFFNFDFLLQSLINHSKRNRKSYPVLGDVFQAFPLLNEALPHLFCGWDREGQRQLKMNEWVLCFHTRKGKKEGGEGLRLPDTGSFWERESYVLLTHTHSHALPWAPSSPSKQQVPVRCVWSPVGVCVRVRVRSVVLLVSVSPLLHRLAPPVVTAGRVPLRLAAGRRPDAHGLRSNGSVQEGEAGWPARVRFDLCERDFTGMQPAHFGKGWYISESFFFDPRHWPAWCSINDLL